MNIKEKIQNVIDHLEDVILREFDKIQQEADNNAREAIDFGKHWQEEKRARETAAADLTTLTALVNGRDAQTRELLGEVLERIKMCLCDHCEDHRAEGNCLPDEAESCTDLKLYKKIVARLRNEVGDNNAL